MRYTEIPAFKELTEALTQYAVLMDEYGADGVAGVLAEAETALKAAVDKMKALPPDKALAQQEPDGLAAIKALRAPGPRKLWNTLDDSVYLDKLEGAMLARFAGCILGAPVEFWTVEAMEKWAEYTGFAFPPTDYWPAIKNPSDLRYEISPFEAYTKPKMTAVPADDDITYTILGMHIAEDHGVDFTTEDVGAAWLKYLPIACTAEQVALENLKKGISAQRAADVDNPYCQWIGADIRSDPWAYMAPAWPEKAAELAWRDACLSHRRNGIYGAMYFAAAQSAAFSADNPLDALKLGLAEIPAQCALHRDIEWALAEGRNIKGYRDARAAVDEHFKGMSGVHTNNNACLTVFGLLLGGGDVTRTISEIVAMGMDNDCTAATAGSIVGAISGKKNLPAYWYLPFNNRVVTYISHTNIYEISDLVGRFAALAHKVYQTG